MNFNKNIPKIVVATGVLAVVFSLVSVGKGKNALNNYGQQYLPEDGSGTNQIDALQIANTIHDVMRKTNFSNTNKNEIVLSAFANISLNQFAQVIKAFGLRFYNPNLGNDYTILGVKPNKYSLAFWLRKELNDDEYNTLKSRFSKYLK